jgi:hypothetical protein
VKTYTLTTDDDRQLARAIQADDLAFVLQEMDERLRRSAKHCDGMAAEFADSWRTTLHDIAGDNNVLIGGLFE